MNFFIVDDSSVIRDLLSNIIEEENLGFVAGEGQDGTEVYLSLLEKFKIDILLLDLLMPQKGGLDVLEEIIPAFNGKVIMISQIETKEIIGKAYSLGIDQYIMKPINRTEVISVIKNVSNVLRLEKSLNTIQKSLSNLTGIIDTTETKQVDGSTKKFKKIANNILMDLGIEHNVKKEFLEILTLKYQSESTNNLSDASLTELYDRVIQSRNKGSNKSELLKERKAIDQRIRRATHHALKNIAAIGLTDFSNIKFERYSTTLFDYSQVRNKMMQLEGKPAASSIIQLNIKQFISSLYMMIKEELTN